jgi:hypothetical protein
MPDEGFVSRIQNGFLKLSNKKAILKWHGIK